MRANGRNSMTGVVLQMQRVTLVWLAALLLLPVPTIFAQTITGRITEQSRRVVAHADVLITDSTGAVIRAAIADSAGTYSVTVPAGSYRVTVRKLGYATESSALVAVSAGARASIDVTLRTQGVPLNALVITGELERGRAGFARRRAAGSGVFLDTDSIAARSPQRIMHAFRNVEGIELDERNTTTQPLLPRTTRGAQCLAVFVDNNPRPYALSIAGANPFQGRTPTLAAGGADVDVVHRLTEVRALEIYRTWQEVPAELRQADRLANVSPRGVALIWTAEGW